MGDFCTQTTANRENDRGRSSRRPGPNLTVIFSGSLVVVVFVFLSWLQCWLGAGPWALWCVSYRGRQAAEYQHPSALSHTGRSASSPHVASLAHLDLVTSYYCSSMLPHPSFCCFSIYYWPAHSLSLFKTFFFSVTFIDLWLSLSHIQPLFCPLSPLPHLFLHCL